MHLLFIHGDCLGVTRPWIYSRQEQEFSASTQNYPGALLDFRPNRFQILW